LEAMLVILDNTVLTNFARIGRADLVFALWPGAVCTVLPVSAEYQVAAAQGSLSPGAWHALPILALSDAELQLANELTPAQLGAGERACLAAAILRQGLFASDDFAARRSAAQHNVALTGTLGILVACVQRGLSSQAEANSLLTQMIAAGYRSPIARLDE